MAEPSANVPPQFKVATAAEFGPSWWVTRKVTWVITAFAGKVAASSWLNPANVALAVPATAVVAELIEPSIVRPASLMSPPNAVEALTDVAPSDPELELPRCGTPKSAISWLDVDGCAQISKFPPAG